MQSSIPTLEEIRTLIKGFETGTLPASEWTHGAHLTVAAWYCSHHPLDIALDNMRKGIIRYNEAVGTPNTDSRGYHETLTVFWIRTVAGFLASQPESTGAGRKHTCAIEK